MGNKRILVIDDHLEMTQLLKVDLEAEGYTVSVAHDGQEGLEQIKKSKPDLIILDVIMPTMDGYEMLELINGNQSTKDIPIIMLTAQGFETDIEKGLDLGADDYIVKSFHSSLLLKRIQTLLKKDLK